MLRQFSAPGRIEISGNHTDHQNGHVLAAAVNMETLCEAEPNNDSIIHIRSKGYEPIEIDLSDTTARDTEKHTSAALVRGVADWLRSRDYCIGGFDGVVSTSIPVGFGLSASASFEVLIGRVIKGLYDDNISSIDIAIAGQYAENNYYGKPCGLMDQLASSLGGCMHIDLIKPERPVITGVNAGLPGYKICVVNTGAGHADLTDEYAAVTDEKIGRAHV